MRVDTDNPRVSAALVRIRRLLLEHSGFVADDLIVRERSGQFSCAIGRDEHVAGRLLVSYPMRLAVPMHELTLGEEGGALMALDGFESLRPVHRELLECWLVLVNETRKMSGAREVLPSAAVKSPELKTHLAVGAPGLRRAGTATDDSIRRTIVEWHSASVPGRQPGDPPRLYLYSLKNLVNHHHTGAPQGPFDGRTGVVTSASSDSVETYENYGDLDAFQALVSMGFVPRDAPMVHSIPLDFEDTVFGRVRVLGKARRGSAVKEPPRAPRLTPTSGGLDIAHLTARPGNRAATVVFLSMALQSERHTSPRPAMQAAEDLLDRIAAANIEFYRELDRLLARPDVRNGTGKVMLELLAGMSQTQRRILRQHWG